MYLSQHQPVQPVGGLFSALALNAAELDKQQASQQARALLKTLGPAQPGPAVPAPLAYEPAPEAASWQHNVAGFLRTLQAPLDSRNPYNDHRYFAHAAVLAAGWADAPAGVRFELAPGRAGVKWPDGHAHNAMLARRFVLLLSTGSYDKRYPVLLDADGRILDGLHRLRGCAEAGQRYYFLQLNF
jgi:hypothetical protein